MPNIKRMSARGGGERGGMEKGSQQGKDASGIGQR